MPSVVDDPFGQPVGVVLAGGAGRRLGGDKARAPLAGRPLWAWVAAALATVVGEVVIAARPDTALEGCDREVWREPLAGPRHPLAGLAAALQRSGGRGVLACPVDLPFVTPGLLAALLTAPGDVAVAEGQPLLGRFPAAAGPDLGAAARAGDPARATVAALAPTVVAVADAAHVLFNVNTADDLMRAGSMAGGG